MSDKFLSEFGGEDDPQANLPVETFIPTKPRPLWVPFLDAIYPYFTALWVGALAGLLSGMLTEWNGVWPILAASLTCYLASRIMVEGGTPVIAGYAKGVLWVTTLCFCWVLFIGQQDKLREKARRYDEFVDNWKYVSHDHAIDEFENGLAIDEYHRTH